MLDYLFTKTPLIFLTQNLWRDEAFSYLLAKEPISKMLPLTAGDFSPPLYYIVLHYWMSIFGTSEVALRSLSTLFFVLTFYVIYLILTEIFKWPKIKTVLAFILFILNPFLNFYAAEARMYMMVTFFVTLSYYGMWTGRKKLYISSMILALYTQYFAIFILAAQWLPRLVQWVYKHKNQLTKKKQLISLVKYLSEPLLIGLFFTPWVIFMIIRHNFADSGFWILLPPKTDLLYVPFLLYTGYERVFGEYYHGKEGYTAFHDTLRNLLWCITLLPLVLNGLTRFHFLKNQAGKYENLPKKQVTDVFLWAFFAPVMIFIISYLYQPLFHPRYYIYASTGFFILLLLAFDELWRHKNSIFKVGGIAIFLLLIEWTWNFDKLNLKYRSKRNIAPVVKEVMSLAGKDDLIYTESELDYHLIQYYMGKDKDRLRIYGKTYEEIPAYVGKVIIPPSAFAYDLPYYPQKAFVIGYMDYKIMTSR
jgi:uncharacterized membrane protein